MPLDLLTPPHLQVASFAGLQRPPEFHASYLRARETILACPDVVEVLDLAQFADGSWLYLIRTPWPTFPKFIIGLAHRNLQTAEIKFECGAEWNARAEWHRLRFRREPDPDYLDQFPTSSSRKTGH